MISIDRIRELCNNNSVNWTEHIARRMLIRGIARRQVLHVIITGEIIEQYENDTPYPSCLLLGRDDEGRPLHVVCGLAPDSVWLITAYYPDPDEWEEDRKTRRTST